MSISVTDITISSALFSLAKVLLHYKLLLLINPHFNSIKAVRGMTS